MPRLSLLLLIAPLLGCDPYETRLPESGATLAGTVTLNGENVPFAMISIVSETSSATGNVEDGQYKVENVPLGTVIIAVNTPAARGQFISQQMAQSYKGPGGKGSTKPAARFLDVPSKYWEAETSGLTTSTKRGQNNFDIPLTK